MDRRIFRIGGKPDAQAERRPSSRRRVKVRKRLYRFLQFGLERVDPQIERRAARERRSLGGALVTESARKVRIEPFRIVSGDPRRCIGGLGRFQSCPLAVGERRRGKARAVRQSRDLLGVKLALEPQHSEHDRPRTLLPHDVGA